MPRGMHHRPSAARRRAAQTAGGGFAVLTLMGAQQGIASAAEGPLPQSVLDQIIDCESDGDPRAQNPSSSASGLYQIIDSTWRAYGGAEFAPRARDASPEQQTVVAQRIYEGQGVGAWETCDQAREAILDWEQAGRPADQAAPPPAASTLAPSPPPAAAESEAAESAATDPTAPEAGPLQFDRNGDGRVMCQADLPAEERDFDTQQQAQDAFEQYPEELADLDRAGGEGDGKACEALPDEEPEGQTQEEAQEELDNGTIDNGTAGASVDPDEVEVNLQHIVVRDDTISLVALAEGICTPEADIRTCWQDFYEQNRDVVGDNPDLIFPGQVLTYHGLALRNPPVPIEEPTPEGGDPAVVEEEDAPAVAEPPSPPEVVEEAAEDAPVVSGGFALPVPGVPGSTNFGAPRDGGSRSHEGLDLDCAMGDPIVAATDGIVTFSGQRGGYGNVIYLVAPDGTETRYAHLSSRGVDEGDVLVAGDELGACGNTGNVVAGPNGDGSHLHFEVRPGGGAAIDPLPWLRERGLA